MPFAPRLVGTPNCKVSYAACSRIARLRARAAPEPTDRTGTKEQSKRLQSIMQNHGAKLRAHTDQAMEALVKEAEKMLSLLESDELRAAGLIASVQKLEHYEIAAYGTAAALAGELDLRDDQRMLHDSLEEERKADAALTKLAKEEVNQDAVA